jgi:hypothetical protein
VNGPGFGLCRGRTDPASVRSTTNAKGGNVAAKRKATAKKAKKNVSAAKKKRKRKA